MAVVVLGVIVPSGFEPRRDPLRSSRLVRTAGDTCCSRVCSQQDSPGRIRTAVSGSKGRYDWPLHHGTPYVRLGPGNTIVLLFGPRANGDLPRFGTSTTAPVQRDAATRPGRTTLSHLTLRSSGHQCLDDPIATDVRLTDFHYPRRCVSRHATDASRATPRRVTVGVTDHRRVVRRGCTHVRKRGRRCTRDGVAGSDGAVLRLDSRCRRRDVGAWPPHARQAFRRASETATSPRTRVEYPPKPLASTARAIRRAGDGAVHSRARTAVGSVVTSRPRWVVRSVTH